jgi:hypothetical protein
MLELEKYVVKNQLCRMVVAVMAIVATVTAGEPLSAQENNTPPRGFVALFNGGDLDGWHGMKTMDPRKMKAMNEQEYSKLREANAKATETHWIAANGAIVNDGKGPYLTTDKWYGDMELLIDYKTVAKADSGIYLRATPQVQIWDYTDEGKFGIGADKGSGGLWNNSKGAKGKDPLVKADKPFGQWNRFRILQIGDKTSIWLNGKLVVDRATMENYWDKSRKTPLISRGPIQLQTHGGEIQWKNIFVREISTEEANKELRQGEEKSGFKTLFNGENFDGWAGPVQNYQIIDGAIQCKAGKGGTIYTTDEYQDFVVRLEYKLPAGGNNGLAIRYPGRGDTAYVGMCELQVLDNTAVRYAKLDSRQYHGSAYGMVAAHRGFQRAIGEWNYQQVSVKGSTIKVELNGFTILDTDLSTVTEYMGGRPHPGKTRTSGYFGLAGHSDTVQYRNISIKSIND